VFRRLVILVALESMAITGVQVQAQEQQQPQSLAEVARQTRKAKEEREKNSGAPKFVVTDDTLGSSKTGGALNFVNPTNGTVPTSEALTKAAGMLDRADRLLNLLAPMDKTTLARFALEGRDVDFPERSDWENKLYAAKQYYVSHGRDLVRETREFVANIQELLACRTLVTERCSLCRTVHAPMPISRRLCCKGRTWPSKPAITDRK
jgi:hypothetical protein